MGLFVSQCCKVEAITTFPDLPDFLGDDPRQQKVSTAWFVCSLCNKPCDIVPLEEVMGETQGKVADYLGWICPKCNRVNAPFIAWCPCVQVAPILPEPYQPYNVPATGDPLPPPGGYTVYESEDYSI